MSQPSRSSHSVRFEKRDVAPLPRTIETKTIAEQTVQAAAKLLPTPIALNATVEISIVLDVSCNLLTDREFDTVTVSPAKIPNHARHPSEPSSLRSTKKTRHENGSVTHTTMVARKKRSIATSSSL